MRRATLTPRGLTFTSFCLALDPRPRVFSVSGPQSSTLWHLDATPAQVPTDIDARPASRPEDGE